MRFSRVTALIGPDREHLHQIELVANAGAFYTLLPLEICERIVLSTPVRDRIRSADGRMLRMDLGVAHFALAGREGAIMIGCVDVREPLLGSNYLEALGFRMNPESGALEIERAFPEVPLFVS